MFTALAHAGLPVLVPVPHAVLMGTSSTSLPRGSGPAIHPHQSNMPSQSEECRDEPRSSQPKPGSDLPCALASAHSLQCIVLQSRRNSCFECFMWPAISQLPSHFDISRSQSATDRRVPKVGTMPRTIQYTSEWAMGLKCRSGFQILRHNDNMVPPGAQIQPWLSCHGSTIIQ